MYIQFQASYANTLFEGSGTYSYKNNKKAKEEFFNSLSDGKDFYAGDSNDKVKLDIKTVEKTERADNVGGYMKFTATATYENRNISVPIFVKGIVTFSK
ncbi:MAG TPA: hypothetical protein PK526_03980 [bacterium]|nr:hypothetical protein [bacterium]